ncbi:MAG: ATP-dependent helicase, partial [Gemmatimonadales bacterium]
NYRSTSIILDAANGVISENVGRMGKTLRTVRQGGERVTLIACADERDEAEWIVRELGNRRARGDAEWRDVAILYRTNSQSRALEESLRRAAVPYRLVGAISFYDRREVKDLLAYLRLVANPRDDQAFLRVIGVPRRGIGDSTLATLSEHAAKWGRPLLETAGIADRIAGLRPNVRSALVNFAAMMDQIRTRAENAPPAQVIEDVIRAINYEEVLGQEGPEGVERWENVRELLASAADWSEVAVDDEVPGTPLERFLAEAALLTSTDNVVGDQEGVTLMTLHTAKGLEWPIVIMSGMEDGLFPLARSVEQPDGVEEERRLCYVGLTRARSKLYLSWARSRRRGGEMRPGRPSRFLSALPPGDVDEERTSSLWSLPSRPDRRRAGPVSRPAAGAFGSAGGWLSDAVGSGRTEAPAAEDLSQDTPRYV